MDLNYFFGFIDGVPSLPVYIGNTLLNIVSEFFIVFILMTIVILAYVSIFRREGEWKEYATTAGMILAGIAIILSANIKYDADEFQGENEKRYLIVESISNSALLGSLMADMLTRSVLYGTYDGTSNSLSDGYFGKVLRTLVTKSKETKNAMNGAELAEIAKLQVFFKSIVTDRKKEELKTLEKALIAESIEFEDSVASLFSDSWFGDSAGFFATITAGVIGGDSIMKEKIKLLIADVNKKDFYYSDLKFDASENRRTHGGRGITI
ncbi:MAG: hypothetical protein HOG49_42135, partial [Candidatus Scalindua sp.]|nr:hypothetical protein [Candidatus Scalindua sp.]